MGVIITAAVFVLLAVGVLSLIYTYKNRRTRSSKRPARPPATPQKIVNVPTRRHATYNIANPTTARGVMIDGIL